MIRLKFFLVAAVLSGYQLAQAQIEVQYSGGVGERNAVLDDGQTAVPDGNTVEIGYFTPGFDVSANAGNLAALGAAWHPFGSTTISTFAPFPPPVPGRFTGDNISSDASFTGQKIYLWIFDTVGAAVPSSGYTNVLQYGIFSNSSITSGNSAWIFPTTTPPGNLEQLSSNDVDQFVFGGLNGSGVSLQLAAATVPEPTSLALLGIGLVFVVRRALESRGRS